MSDTLDGQRASASRVLLRIGTNESHRRSILLPLCYLRCGILDHGFLRLACLACGHERLVAFS